MRLGDQWVRLGAGTGHRRARSRSSAYPADTPAGALPPPAPPYPFVQLAQLRLLALGWPRQPLTHQRRGDP